MHYWNVGMGLMGLVPLVWALLIGGIVWAVVASTSRHASTADSPEAVLKRRYASGEMSQEEYERKLAALRR